LGVRWNRYILSVAEVITPNLLLTPGGNPILFFPMEITVDYRKAILLRI
jgi:hypothetical protein